jgi:copper chaperone CopZ
MHDHPWVDKMGCLWHNTYPSGVCIVLHELGDGESAEMIEKEGNRMDRKSTLYAPDISCAHCAMTIKREMSFLDGIVSIEVNVEDKLVVLAYTDAAALERAKVLLNEIGYPATNA